MVLASSLLAVPTRAAAQASEIGRCIAESMMKGALGAIPGAVVAAFGGGMRMDAKAAAAYGAQMALNCTINSQVVVRNAAARKLLRQQVSHFEKQSKLFNLERRIGAGDTPGTETEIGRGALRFVRFTPADMTTAWFAKLAAGPKKTRAMIAMQQTLALQSHAELFHDNSAIFETRRYQALVEGAEEASEAALSAEEQARDAKRFADIVEQRLVSEAPSSGRSQQYSTALEHRRAIDLNQQLRAAISDVRGMADEVSAEVSPMSLGRATGLRRLAW